VIGAVDGALTNPLLITVGVLSLVGTAGAWGPLGHRIVAETAAILVDDDMPTTWGPILARHRFQLAVYAFVPDSRFRHIDGHGGKLEAPTHYLDLDAPKGTVSGSVDRRVGQFHDRARDQFSGVRAPGGGYVQGATAKGDERRIYLGLLELGVMAHYSGDAAVPYHATTDSNGFARGQGGIHFYFESACVDALEPGLATDVLAAARAGRTDWIRSWRSTGSTPKELVRAVLKESLSAVEEVSAIDRKHAVARLQPGGSTRNAERKPAAEGCVPMRPILVERLAKGAVLTALLWETALPREGVDFERAGDLTFSDLEAAPAYVPPQE